MKTDRLFLILLCSLLLHACSGKHEPAVTEQQLKQTEEAMVGANRIMLQKEKEKIARYDSLHHLEMKESGSGLWYRINFKGTGPLAKFGDVVTLAYNVSLLDGTPCYSSEKSGPKTFKVGQGGVESGLEEGILYLAKGGRALFVMPPHLAAGFPGDGDKIPPRSVIVYQVEVLNIGHP
jgi:FKBP-type peptidyl-prolyl cis-trans isomerase FkpA